MRPLGDVSQAVLSAARELATPARAPTLVELQHRACVSACAARATVQNLKRSGHLHIVRERKVDYRNRRVAEYAPVDAAAEPADTPLVLTLTEQPGR